MIELTLAEVAGAVGGGLYGCEGTELVTGGVEFDSRRITPGGLFVAVPGERVVNDAYNANPESVAAALRTLVVMTAAHRRSWAVLGSLAELGEATDQAYRDIGALTTRLGVDRLVVVGEQARQLHHAAPGSVLVPDVPSALDLLHGELAPGDVVLIKASRSAGLERIADGLLGATGSIGTGSISTGPIDTGPIDTGGGSGR